MNFVLCFNNTNLSINKNIKIYHLKGNISLTNNLNVAIKLNRIIFSETKLSCKQPPINKILRQFLINL